MARSERGRSSRKIDAVRRVDPAGALHAFVEGTLGFLGAASEDSGEGAGSSLWGWPSARRCRPILSVMSEQAVLRLGQAGVVLRHVGREACSDHGSRWCVEDGAPPGETSVGSRRGLNGRSI